MNEYLKKYREKQMISQFVYLVKDYDNQAYIIKFIYLFKNKRSSIKREKKILKQGLPKMFITLLSDEEIINDAKESLTVLKFNYYPTDLKDYLLVNQSIQMITYRKWARQICDGMDQLHKKNILHRDLKPENILLTESNENADVVIADLGFSINIEESKAKTILGTENYIAPEILRRNDYNGKIDVYSYGALVYYMLFKEYVKFDSNGSVLYPENTNPDRITIEFFSKTLKHDPKIRASFEELLKLEFLNFAEAENILPAKFVESEINNFDEESIIEKEKYIVKKELKNFEYIKIAFFYLYVSGPNFFEIFTTETRDVFMIYFHKFSKKVAKKIYEKIFVMNNIQIPDELNNLKFFIESETIATNEMKMKFANPITREIKNKLQNYVNIRCRQNYKANHRVEKVFYHVLKKFNLYIESTL
ncbi:hypothetical protein SteCoe_28938 [Stentor coeruleus]|uniref:Protein kinase domain-containing protein n=1 Tax=Stentor coeruleus TaxID=5963 RepID=A0A1R2B739_9CILI|nr:hypothetical protein SteCoe_28938 [Stentor coeruleus]